MAKEKEKEILFDDLINYGVSQILRAFGKGEDLRGAVAAICDNSAKWGADLADKRSKKRAELG